MRLGDLRIDVALGLLTFFGMLVISVVFYEERTTFLDLAYHLFEQARRGTVAIQNYRFVSALTQYLPTQLLGAGVDMKTVQLVYSLVFPVFYGSVWAITYFGLRAREWALAWTLLWAAFATHTHFWVQSELPQGLAILVLALPLVGCQPRTAVARVLVRTTLPALLFTVAFAHPLLVVPVTFCFGLLWCTQFANRIEISVAALTYYVFFGLRATVFATEYDATAGGGIKEGLRLLRQGWLPFSVERFAPELLTEYYAFVLVFVLALALLWRSGAELAAGWTALAVGGHFALVAIAYPTDATAPFYFENLLLPMGFMAAAGLAFGVFRAKYQGVSALRQNRYSTLLCVAILVLACVRILSVGYTGRSTYSERLRFLKTTLKNERADKRRQVIRRPTEKEQRGLIMTWGSPYEAWIVSLRENRPTQGFQLVDKPAALAWAAYQPGTFVTEWGAWPFADLPAAYFTAPPDSTGYLLVE